jgi:hypothetical protein
MKKLEHNIAYIDGANLHQGIRHLRWELDYARFRVWLREKYAVDTAYLFIGLIPKYTTLYTALQQAGYVLVFKETVVGAGGAPKGNCDADLVLRATIDVFEMTYNRSILVSSDGDYAGLVKFLSERSKMDTILSPHPKDRCSILLKRTNVPIVYLNDLREQLKIQSIKEKAPGADGTAQGSSS